jgi:CHAT domain-containing protein
MAKLPGSRDEARLVARYAPDAELRLGPDASASFLRHAPLERYGVIHLATHAVIDERSPTRTALLLASVDSVGGLVTPAELSALRLDAGVVVLSACRSASGVVVDGEGMQGLTAPLLSAGSRAVVATRWLVSDRASVPFMQAFYDALASGRDVGGALRVAKLDARRRGAPAAQWAAYAVLGDPSVRVPVTRPSANARGWWWIIVGAMLVALAALRAWTVPRPAAAQRTSSGRSAERAPLAEPDAS